MERLNPSLPLKIRKEIVNTKNTIKEVNSFWKEITKKEEEMMFG